jgi:hypothetical protein
VFSRAGLAAAVPTKVVPELLLRAVGLECSKNIPALNYAQINEVALQEEIRKARSLTQGNIGLIIWLPFDVTMTDWSELPYEEKVD